MKKLFAVLALVLTLAACGGGDGGSSGSSSTGSTGGSSSTSSPGGGSGSSSPTPPPSASVIANVVKVVVDNSYNFINAPYVSVTICTPGTNNCATIDHVMLDTGSVGLRLLRSAIPASLGLTNATDPVGGNTLAECSEFGAGHAWGPISTVDLKMAGETASSLPMQIIDDSFATMPTNCAAFGPDMAANGAQSFGANGLLGVDVLRRDCLEGCDSPSSTLYYDCAGATCSPIAMPVADQLPNPISWFSRDNNGMTLSFPAVPAGGSASVTGTMTFGINTQSDNQQANLTKIVTTADATVSASYNGQTLHGILDSGSGAYFIPDTTITQCPSSFSTGTWFCPAQQVSRTATLQSELGGSVGVQFDIVNAMSELSGNNSAHTGVGEDVNVFGAGLLDLGMPFFFGKTLTFGIQSNDNFAAGVSPFFSIQS